MWNYALQFRSCFFDTISLSFIRSCFIGIFCASIFDTVRIENREFNPLALLCLALPHPVSSFFHFSAVRLRVSSPSLSLFTSLLSSSPLSSSQQLHPASSLSTQQSPSQQFLADNGRRSLSSRSLGEFIGLIPFFPCFLSYFPFKSLFSRVYHLAARLLKTQRIPSRRVTANNTANYHKSRRIKSDRRSRRVIALLTQSSEIIGSNRKLSEIWQVA